MSARCTVHLTMSAPEQPAACRILSRCRRVSSVSCSMVPRTGWAVLGSTGPWPLAYTQPSISTAAEYAPVLFSLSGCLISFLAIVAAMLGGRCKLSSRAACVLGLFQGRQQAVHQRGAGIGRKREMARE